MAFEFDSEEPDTAWLDDEQSEEQPPSDVHFAAPAVGSGPSLTSQPPLRARAPKRLKQLSQAQYFKVIDDILYKYSEQELLADSSFVLCLRDTSVPFEEKWICCHPNCTESGPWLQRNHAVSHVKSMHIKSTRIVCPNCGNSYQNDSNLKRHQASCTGKGKVND